MVVFSFLEREMVGSFRRWRVRLPWLAVPAVLWWADPNATTLQLGAGLALLGLALRAWAAGTIEKTERLTVSGPYAFTRNPLYLGSFLMGVGLVLATARPLLVAATVLFFAALYHRTIRDEERLLEHRYGESYRAYRRAVPAFFPRLTPYRAQGAAELRFRASRYLRHREYQAALGVLAMLAALTADYVW